MKIKIFNKEFKIGQYPKIINANCIDCGANAHLEVYNDINEFCTKRDFVCPLCTLARNHMQQLTDEYYRRCWIIERDKIIAGMKTIAEEHDKELIKGGNKHGNNSTRSNCKINKKR